MIFELKSFDEIQKPFLQPIVLIYNYGPSTRFSPPERSGPPDLCGPAPAHLGPFSFLRTLKPPPIQPRRRVSCHRWSPSCIQMELNRRVAWQPSLSHTSSAPVESPPPFTPRNGQELTLHYCRPPTSPVLPHLALSGPIKGTPIAAATSTTHSRCPHFFSVPPSATPPSSSRHRHPSPLSAKLSHPTTQ
jgi:hypothetical protein